MVSALRRGFLLPKDDICNIGEVVIFSIYHRPMPALETGGFLKIQIFVITSTYWYFRHFADTEMISEVLFKPVFLDKKRLLILLLSYDKLRLIVL
jgi:hypothetical protein